MLRVTLENNDTQFEPGAQLVVTAEWELETEQREVDLRLIWFTRGKGTTDVAIVQRLAFENPPLRDSKRLGIQLPEAPYSFSGLLISLVWALELVAEPSGETSRLEFV